MFSIAAMMMDWGSLECDGEKFAQEGKCERILTDEICFLVEQYFDEHPELEFGETTIYEAANWVDNLVEDGKKLKYKSDIEGSGGFTESAMVLPFRAKGSG